MSPGHCSPLCLILSLILDANKEQRDTMTEKRLTSELLEQLLASATPEAYLATIEPEDRTLADLI